MSTSDVNTSWRARPGVLFAILFGINVLNYTDRFVLPAVASSIKLEFSLSDAEVGLLGTAFLSAFKNDIIVNSMLRVHTSLAIGSYTVAELGVSSFHGAKLSVLVSDPLGRLLARFRATARRFPIARAVLLPVYRSVESILWPIRRLLSNKRPVAIPTKYGFIYLVPEGHIAQAVWQWGFEESERTFVERQLKPGMCVINVGANSGLYAVLAGRIVGPSGEVHAFEPATVNVDRLQRNLALNGLSNVAVNHCAVSDTSGAMDLCRDPTHPQLDSHYSVRALGGGRGDLIECVQSTSLDDYWLRHNRGKLRPVDMIIIDVEGAELQVIKGAMSLLGASPGVIIMAECTKNLEEMHRILDEVGFSFYLWNTSAARLEPTEIARGNMFISRERDI